MNQLSKRLTLLRERQGWTKAETARRLGLKAPSTYGNWEYAIREPDLETVTKIASLYDVSVDYLLGKNAQTAPTDNSSDLKLRLDEILNELKNREEATFGEEQLSSLAANFLMDQLNFAIEQTKKLNDQSL